nr:hypothetical protein [Tanacetum cinerariifolium]
AEIVGDDEVEDDAEYSARDTIEIEVNVVTEPEVPDDILVPTTNETPKETFEIRLDVVIQELYDHMLEFHAHRFADIEGEHKAQEIRALINERQMARLLDRVKVLEGSNLRLRDALGVEKEMADSVQLHLGYVKEELTQAIEELITQRVAEALAEQEANPNLRPVVKGESENGDDNNGGNRNGKCGGNGNGNGRRNGNNGNNNGNGNQNRMNGGVGGVAPIAKACTYKNFLNC